jgi:hypothetical protein
MRSLVVAAGLALCSGSALAADFGVGLSARSTEDGWLYAPIDFSGKFRLEPAIRYASTEWDDGDYRKTLEFGIGAFGLRKVTEAARLYYGARFSYIDGKESLSLPGAYVDQTLEGYSIIPTAGVEYSFGRHFSVGGEVGYAFVQLDYDSTSFSYAGEGDVETQSTQTRFIVRYTF